LEAKQSFFYRDENELFQDEISVTKHSVEVCLHMQEQEIVFSGLTEVENRSA
jgi:hypothetical protein